MTRVVTWNIRGGLGMDGKRSVDRISETLTALEPDFVCLQEVHCRFPQSGFEDQPRILSARTGMRLTWIPSFRAGIGSFGNVILSRHQPAAAGILPLPNERERSSLKMRMERRAALWAQFDVEDASLTVVSTHWSLNAQDRVESARALSAFLSGRSGRVIGCGDLNAGPDSAEVRDLLAAGGLMDAGAAEGVPTFPAGNERAQRARIDYVLLGPPLSVRSIDVRPSLASDHLPVVCDVERVGSLHVK